MEIKRIWFLGCVISILILMGCSGNSLIITSPPNAKVTLNDTPLDNKMITYGRWIGNSYDIHAEAPGFISQNLKLSPHLGSKSTLISVMCLATVVGIPILPSVFWNGELDDKIYITLEYDNAKVDK
ncbi:MAG: hypothetical protein WCL60_11945 [Methylococcales bacterium]